jgi:hypothetical protein
MARCETCGNEYDKAFVVTLAGQPHTFDSFECAIHTLAPSCAHCGCKVVGHGVEANGVFYCCAHCANASGVAAVHDRA